MKKTDINFLNESPISCVSFNMWVDFVLLVFANWEQAFSQVGVQPSCGRPLIKENCFAFHIKLPYEFFTWAGPIAYFGRPLIKSWLKAWLGDDLGWVVASNGCAHPLLPSCLNLEKNSLSTMYKYRLTKPTALSTDWVTFFSIS